MDEEFGETLDYRLGGVGLAFSKDEDKCMGVGELIITTKRVIWIKEANESAGVDENGCSAFDFDVPYIILHAISRDPESYPVPCLYCQLDKEEEEFVNECEEDGDEYDTGEVFLVPPKGGDDQLQAMFDAFSHAALLNPDPLSGDEGDDYEGTNIATNNCNENSAGFIFNGEEVRLGASQAATLAHLESVFMDPAEQQAVEEAHHQQWNDT